MGCSWKEEEAGPALEVRNKEEAGPALELRNKTAKEGSSDREDMEETVRQEESTGD